MRSAAYLCVGVLLTGSLCAMALDVKADAKPQYQRLLQDEDAKKAADLEKRCREHMLAGRFADALTLARELAALRSQVQGADHWQTVNARQHVALLADVVTRPADDQAALAKSFVQQREAAQLSKQQQAAKALPLLNEALATRRRLLGEDHFETAVLHYRLGEALYEQAEFAEAAKHLRAAVATTVRLFGDNHTDSINSLEALGRCLDKEGKYVDAMAFARRALTASQKVLGDADPLTNGCRKTMAYNLQDLGRHAEAEPLYRRALEVDEQIHGKDSKETATSCLGVANCVDAQGRYKDAEPLFRRALDMRRKVLGEESDQTATTYHDLAGNLDGQARYAEAETFARRALEIMRRARGEEQFDTLVVANTLAVILDKQGKLAEAELLKRRLVEVAPRVWGAQHPNTAGACNNLAINLKQQRKYAEADPLFRQTLAICEKVLGPEHVYTALTCDNLASNLGAQGKYAEAEQMCRRALKIFEKAYGEDHPSTAKSCLFAGDALAFLGRFDEADKFDRRALEICRRVQGPDHPDTVEASLVVARQLIARGDTREAERLATAARKSFAGARLRVAYSGLERSAFSASHAPYPILAMLRAHRGDARAATEALEEHLGRGLLDDATAVPLRRQRMTEVQRSREAELLSQLQRLDGQITALRASRKPTEATRQQADRLSAERDRTQAAMAEFLEGLEKDYGPAAGQVYDLARIQGRLPADAGLMTWLDLAPPPGRPQEKHYHWACVVRARGEPAWVMLRGSGADGAWTEADLKLPQQVQHWLSRPPQDDDAAGRRAAELFYQQRLAPLAPHLAAADGLPAVRRLILLPASSTAELPIEAVQAVGDGAPAACTISYAPSGTLYALLSEKRTPATREEKIRPRRLLAVGDPVFVREGVPALPGTRREVQAVAALFPETETLLGSDASEQRLEALASSKSGLRAFDFLHLATHGELNAQRGLASALLLAEDHLPDPLQRALEGKPAYTGRLSAAQILAGWKLNADLVTLSCCQTALGHYSDGEGYLGFAQALFLAGARSLVLSLWQVDDTATALLMTRFYQNLLGKRDGLAQPLAKAEALREAKEWLRHLSVKDVDQELTRLPQTRGRERTKASTTRGARPFEHPYYWSAFILIGDPE